ncbi:hypothetical protein LguiA_012441 [Lonicera macranthoides]
MSFESSCKETETRQPSQPSPLSSPPPPPPPPQPLSPLEETNNTSTESLSSRIYLNFDRPTTTTTTSTSNTLQESEPPQEFLSNSPDFPLTHQDPLNNSPNPQTTSEDSKDDDQQRVGGCDEGFYAKIVGVKGPKCDKEVKRLEGWIKYFSNGSGKDERIEPLRLAHLLLGKAAFFSGDSDGYGGLEFPSTLDEFLCNDPLAD